MTSPVTGTSRVLPHAVSGLFDSTTYADIELYGYDAKGQMTGGGGRSISWKAFGQPESVTRGGASVTWVYAPDNRRIRQTLVSGGVTEVTDTLGAYEAQTKAGITEHRHYLSAGGETFAVYKSYTGPGAPAAKLQYLHAEALGSVTAVTDGSGALIERSLFDPWGKRMHPNGAADHGGTLTGVQTDRGFTGHEHVDEVRLVNMNGRVYDPLLGRFLSTDPFAQSPDDIQSHDRYAYVMNDPVNAIDPSGYWSLSKWLGAGLKLASNPFKVQNVYAAIATSPGSERANRYMQENAWARTLGHVAAGYFGGPAGSAFVTGYEVYVNGGDGGDIRKAIGLPLATSYAMQGVGTATTGYPVANVVGHAVVGCASSAAGGGSCRDGAISAGVGAAMTQATGPGQATPAKFAGAVVAGGVSSRLTGGDFWEGAKMAATGYLFNELLHQTTMEQSGYEVRRDRLDFVDASVNGGSPSPQDWVLDISALDLSGVTESAFRRAGRSSLPFQLSGSLSTDLGAQLVVGNIELQLIAPGVVTAKPDYFNFERHQVPTHSVDSALRTIGRNYATAVGGDISVAIGVAGNFPRATLNPRGFRIRFEGAAKISP